MRYSDENSRSMSGYFDEMDQLILELKRDGIRSQAVLDAMRSVPRELFVGSANADIAYQNTALPIGYHQTISQPYVVAKMTEALLSKGPLKKVLEIGTGSGYQTARLAKVVREVYSIERIGALYYQAAQRLQEDLHLQNVHLFHADGTQGLTAHAPFEGIIVTAATEEIPQALLEQLAPKGILILPLGFTFSQNLVMVQKEEHGFSHTILDAVMFVPLKPGTSEE